jgi:pseudo-response regulator 1
MEIEELIDLNSKESNCGGNNSKNGDGFIDRSKVRILLCDNDSKSSEELFTLLLNCSYQGMKFPLPIFLANNFCDFLFMLKG